MCSSSGSSESLNEADSSKKQRNRRIGLGKLPLKASLGSVETLQHGEISVLQSLLGKPRVIPTVCVLKPSITTKHLGKVLKRLGQEGFSVIGLKMMILSDADVRILMRNKVRSSTGVVGFRKTRNFSGARNCRRKRINKREIVRP